MSIALMFDASLAPALGSDIILPTRREAQLSLPTRHNAVILRG